MIGIDDPDKVLAWIEERITCHILDKDSDPELHNLVTTYQMHKCTDYCKKTFKKGKVCVKRCKFGYPLPACESAKLHPVAERLKKRQKVYEITRKESETRVNVYNPLLLMLWKANMDVLFVFESSAVCVRIISGSLPVYTSQITSQRRKRAACTTPGRKSANRAAFTVAYGNSGCA